MTNWDIFFRDKCIEIFSSSKVVIDFGGGLRLDTGKSNRVDSKNAWLYDYSKKVDYKIIDLVPDYNPDIVGDIQDIPFGNESIDAIFCLAVLEYVMNPIKAMEELYRVLKPGGKLLIYVPFLFYYHAEKGYFKDYWRFTTDTIEMLSKPFDHCEVMPVRLPIETTLYLTPLGRISFLLSICRKLDKIFYKSGSKQVSGHYVFLVK